MSARSFSRLVTLAAALLLQACASTHVSVVGDGPQAERIRDRWLPKTQDALTRFNAWSTQATGKPLSRALDVRLATNEDAAKAARQSAPEALVVRMNYVFPSDHLHQAVIEPLTLATQALLFELSGGREAQPAWLRLGVGQDVAYNILAGMKTDALTKADWREQIEYALRQKKGVVPLDALLEERPGSRNATGADAMSGFLVGLLEERLGERFEAAWVRYFRAASSPTFNAARAFESSFGMGLGEFGTLAQQRLEALRSRVKTHAATMEVPRRDTQATQPAALETKALRDGFARYQKQPAPKAFVFSRQGIWVFKSDSANAVEWALRECRSVTPIGCKVYAIDDVVTLAATDAPGDVEVVMSSRGNEWAGVVEKRWLPIIKTSAERFVQTVQARLGVTLRDRARIYVVSNREDYSRVLREEINQLKSTAELTAAGSDGFANSRGQMVTAILPDYSEDYRWALTTSVALHEMTHELQGQIAGGYDGFIPPRWLTEGSADQIAYLVAKDIPIDPAAKYAVDDWQQHCTDWYKLGGSRLTKPEDVIGVNYEQWVKLAREHKGPYQMSGLMVMHLESLLGERYYPALIAYWKRAAQAGEKEDAAFTESFGLSKADYMQSLKAWLATLVAY